MKKIKAVLFDIDDTLYDRNKAQIIVLDKIIEQMPELLGHIEKDRILKAFLESDRISTADWNAGFHMDDIRDYRSKLFLKGLQLPGKYADVITEAYVREYPNVYVPVDGAIEIVNNACLRYKTGVISNSMPDVQYRKLETLGLRDRFTCIVIATEIGLRKPDPEIFQYAANILKVNTQECLYIGDSYEHDVFGAKKAGMLTCWLCTNSAYPDNASVKADYKITNLRDAEEILRTI